MLYRQRKSHKKQNHCVPLFEFHNVLMHVLKTALDVQWSCMTSCRYGGTDLVEYATAEDVGATLAVLVEVERHERVDTQRRVVVHDQLLSTHTRQHVKHVLETLVYISTGPSKHITLYISLRQFSLPT